MTMLTAQVIDGLYGRAASAVGTRLDRAADGDWENISHSRTDDCGTIRDWNAGPLLWGVYRLTVDASGYFAGLGLSSAFPEVQVTFRAEEHDGLYQAHVVLAPFSYSATVAVGVTPAG
jgi:5-hydroxyisourate hydrolase